MKEYELTVLVNPDLETDIEAPLKKVRDLVASAGGSITTEENWGKKRLAYSINKQDFAVYVYFELSLPATAPQAMSSVLNITDEIIRYLLVKVDEKGKAALAEAAKKSADKE
jgi:small subunit ribosomal protein S6